MKIEPGESEERNVDPQYKSTSGRGYQPGPEYSSAEKDTLFLSIEFAKLWIGKMLSPLKKDVVGVTGLVPPYDLAVSSVTTGLDKVEVKIDGASTLCFFGLCSC